MKQALLYSINAEHLVNILNGRKTIEVRRRDLPQWAKDKLVRGEKVIGYGYCTKAEPYLNKDMGNWFLVRGIDYIGYPVLNGLVVVKFEVSGTTKYVDCSGCTNTENGYECQNNFMYLLSVDPVLRKATCLTPDEIEDYGNGADLYAHHITNIQPIEPMELSDFVTWDFERWYGKDGNYTHWKPLTKAPQSFQSVWVKGE